MNTERGNRRSTDVAAAHPLVAGVFIGTAFSLGLWALGLSAGASIWVALGVGMVIIVVATAGYPDARDQEGWERWYAERDASD